MAGGQRGCPMLAGAKSKTSRDNVGLLDRAKRAPMKLKRTQHATTCIWTNLQKQGGGRQGRSGGLQPTEQAGPKALYLTAVGMSAGCPMLAGAKSKTSRVNVGLLDRAKRAPMKPQRTQHTQPPVFGRIYEKQGGGGDRVEAVGFSPPNTPGQRPSTLLP
jgi:hypothetical protein